MNFVALNMPCMPYENLRSQAISFLSTCAIVFVVLNEMRWKETRCGLLHNRIISFICKRLILDRDHSVKWHLIVYVFCNDFTFLLV